MHVLVVSRNFPSPVAERLGLWVERQCLALAAHCRVSVVAPVTWCPPGPWPEDYARFRRVPRTRDIGPLRVLHPRFLTGPGLSTHSLDGFAQAAALRSALAFLDERVDLVHAHYAYPDGAAAIRLARQLGVPVVITEHNLWRPWIDRMPAVRRQAVRAVRECDALVVVSRAVQSHVEDVVGAPVRATVIPIGVDGAEFTLRERMPEAGDAETLLYVGWLNRVKGVDVLLRAFALLRERRPAARLRLIGGTLYRSAAGEERALRQLARDLRLDSAVEFEGPRPPDAVARAMRECRALVLPSRRESCGAVLLEALASGTPVIATRCGGPSEIVAPESGELVPVEDPPALAAAMARVLADPGRYDPARLRAAALRSYAWGALARRYLDVYRGALDAR